MADTTFLDNSTVIVSDWLNDVNHGTYRTVIYPTSSQFGAVGDGVTDDTAALNAAITYAESLVTDAFEQAGNGYIDVDLCGKIYGVSASIVISKKIRFGNGALKALSAFPAGTGLTSFILYTSGYGTTRALINNLDVDGGLDVDGTTKLANCIHIYRCQRGRIQNVNTMHGREFGFRVSESQGLQVSNGVFREYLSGETGLSTTSYWTSKVFSVESADCVYSDINSGNGLYPLYISASANQFNNCHFVVPQVTDASTGHVAVYLDSDIVSPSYAVGNIFTGCYFDGGEILIKDSFYQIITGSLFLRASFHANTAGIRLLATQPNLTVEGLMVSGVWDGYGSTPEFVKTTSGSGSWTGRDKIINHTMLKSGAWSDNPSIFPGLEYHSSRQLKNNPTTVDIDCTVNNVSPGCINHDTAAAGYVATRWGANANPVHIGGAKSRSATAGTFGGYLSSGDEICRFFGVPDRGSDFGSAGNSKPGAGMSVVASEAHGVAAQGTRLDFFTTTNGTITTATSRVSLTDAGHWAPFATNTYDLGENGVSSWRNIYSQNAVTVTSDARTKTDIQDAQLGLEFIEMLRPVSYRMLNGGNTHTRELVDKNANGDGEPIYRDVLTPIPGKRIHYGLLAQEVREAVSAAGVSDFGGWVKANPEDPDSLEMLRYDEFISPLIKAVQELSARVKQLESK